MKRYLLFYALVFAFSAHGEGADTPAPVEAPAAPEKAADTKADEKIEKPRKGQSSAVLDFDSDVIEGERKTPDLFLQLQVDTPNLDTLLYQRRNYNDFHELEKNRRPIYRKAAQ